MKRLRATYRKISAWLRRANNRRLRRRGPPPPERPVAKPEDLSRALQEGKVFAAGKIGGAELMALEYQDHQIQPRWPGGWSWRRPAHRLMNNAGFFPVEKKAFLEWHDIMMQAIPSMDYLCSWQTDSHLQDYEKFLIHDLAPASRNLPLVQLGRPLLPFLVPFPWLVVSPFTKTIRRQLPKLREVHDPGGRREVDWSLPVETCQLVRCPFQSHLEPSPYASWREGLEKLTAEVLAEDFAVALIGAGAWSLPLAARIRAAGRSAIHFGGETQLLFGIKGKRWERYGIYNDAWVSPDPSEMPAHRSRVEDGCYW